jgi:hypothetical protein
MVMPEANWQRPAGRPRNAARIAGALAGLVIAVTSSSVWGDPDGDEAQARAYFDLARSEMKADLVELACSHFAASHRLAPSAAGPWLNLALCEERRGHLSAAAHLLREWLAAGVGDEDQRRIAGEHIENVEKLLPVLIVVCAAPTPCTLRIDGGDHRPESPLRLDPGEHVVEVQWGNGAVGRPTITLESSERRQLELEPGPPPIPSESREQEQPSNPWRNAGFVTLGLGGIGLATCLVSGAMVWGKKQQVEELCPDGVCTTTQGMHAARQGEVLSTVSVVSGGIGLAAGAVGMWLLLHRPPGPHDRTLTVRIDREAAVLGYRSSF